MARNAARNAGARMRLRGLARLVLAVSLFAGCQLLPGDPEDPPVSAAPQAGLPAEIESAISSLLHDDGTHPSPLPAEQKAALDRLQAFDAPVERAALTLTDGSTQKEHHFRRCGLTWVYSESAAGERVNRFYVEESAPRGAR